MGTVGAACSVEMDAFLACSRARPYGSASEEAVSDPARTACSELPNDNPGLHRGAIWFAAEVTGAAVFERAHSLAAVATATDPVPAMSEVDEEGDDIEIVDELAFDDAIDESMVGERMFHAVSGSTVDEPAVDDSIGESSAPPEAPRDYVTPIEDVPSSTDPFAMLVSVVEDVAHGAGADDVAMASLACLLGRTRLDASAPDATTHHVLRAQALAWQGILRSESDDFGACGGAMLDEWCAALIAAVLGPTARADMLKRELRRRGVAAFGLVEQAA